MRSLQYIIIPTFSFTLLTVGLSYLFSCPAQPFLPAWHIVAAISGLLLPLLYLLFDFLNPLLSKNYPSISELLDSVIVLIAPVYVLFEVAWLITGTVLIAGIDLEEEVCENKCDATIYMFSVVVVANFWIHILTPLFLLLYISCSRIMRSVCCCTFKKTIKTGLVDWKQTRRVGVCCIVSLSLAGAAMMLVGGAALGNCFDSGFVIHIEASSNVTEVAVDEEKMMDMILIPVWLLVAGIMVAFFPVIYYLYDAFCNTNNDTGGSLKPENEEVGRQKPENEEVGRQKPENATLGNQKPFVGSKWKNVARPVVVVYLVVGLVWAVKGAFWIFGTRMDSRCGGDVTVEPLCGGDSYTQEVAFWSLILLNVIMDAWISATICEVLYWAFLNED